MGDRRSIAFQTDRWHSLLEGRHEGRPSCIQNPFLSPCTFRRMAREGRAIPFVVSCLKSRTYSSVLAPSQPSLLVLFLLVLSFLLPPILQSRCSRIDDIIVVGIIAIGPKSGCMERHCSALYGCVDTFTDVLCCSCTVGGTSTALRMKARLAAGRKRERGDRKSKCPSTRLLGLTR